MELIYPRKLNKGDVIRVIAPSCARSTIDPQVIQKAEGQFEKLGLHVTWGASIGEQCAEGGTQTNFCSTLTGVWYARIQKFSVVFQT